MKILKMSKDLPSGHSELEKLDQSTTHIAEVCRRKAPRVYVM